MGNQWSVNWLLIDYCQYSTWHTLLEWKRRGFGLCRSRKIWITLSKFETFPNENLIDAGYYFFTVLYIIIECARNAFILLGVGVTIILDLCMTFSNLSNKLTKWNRKKPQDFFLEFFRSTFILTLQVLIKIFEWIHFKEKKILNSQPSVIYRLLFPQVGHTFRYCDLWSLSCWHTIRHIFELTGL